MLVVSCPLMHKLKAVIHCISYSFPKLLYLLIDNEQSHPPLSTTTTTTTSKTNKASWPGIEDDSLAFGDKQLIIKCE